MIENILPAIYLLASAGFILAVKWMNHPSTARRGVIIGEIGMVLAHEVAHLVANHPASTQRNAALGRVVGGLIGAVADTGAARGRVYTGGYYTRVGGALVRDIVAHWDQWKDGVPAP